MPGARTQPAFRVKFAVALFAACVCARLIAGDLYASPESNGLTALEKRGREIFLKGADEQGPEIIAVLGGSDLDLPGTSFACANCHGRRGEGASEGGLQPPPVDWKTLSAPHTSALTGRGRSAYTAAVLGRAIIGGVDPENVRLHPGMPRYRMSADQLAALVAYLKKIGLDEDLDPGLTNGTITVGAALPLSGPLASVGEDVRATLSAYFAEVNVHGGIYNRKFELVVEDSKGDAAGTAQATRQLVNPEGRNGVFALVGSFEPSDSTAANSFLSEREVPLVGPTTLSPKLSVPPNRYVFYLLPTFADQARVLVDFIHSKKTESATKLVVISADGEYESDAVAGIQIQAKLYEMDVVFEEKYRAGAFSPSSTIEKLRQKQPDYICFFGAGGDFVRFAREARDAGLTTPLLGSAVMLGRDAFELPPDAASRVMLAYPAPLPGENGFAEFLSLMKRANVPLRNSAFQRSAYAAANIFVEAVKLSSRNLTRDGLVQSLEQMRDYSTGVIPAVSFSPNRRTGSSGALVMGLDLQNKRYVPLSNWLEPKNRPAPQAEPIR